VYLGQRLHREGVPMIEYGQVTGNLTTMANGLIDVIRQRRLLMYPSEELRTAAAQAVLIESSRVMRLGKMKQSNRVDAIVALAMAVLRYSATVSVAARESDTT